MRLVTAPMPAKRRNGIRLYVLKDQAKIVRGCKADPRQRLGVTAKCHLTRVRSMHTHSQRQLPGIPRLKVPGLYAPLLFAVPAMAPVAAVVQEIHSTPIRMIEPFLEVNNGSLSTRGIYVR